MRNWFAGNWQWVLTIALLGWIAANVARPAVASAHVPEVRCIQGRAYVSDPAMGPGWFELTPNDAGTP